MYVKGESVGNNRAARLKASRGYWRGLEKASKYLVRDVPRPLSENKKDLQAQLLKVRSVSAEDGQFSQFYVMVRDPMMLHDPERLTNFTCHALERAVAHVSAHFEADENGWPVWRAVASDHEEEPGHRP